MQYILENIVHFKEYSIYIYTFKHTVSPFYSLPSQYMHFPFVVHCNIPS